MQVVESGGRNIEVATMRQGEPLKIWSDEDVSAPWEFDIFCWRLGFRVQDSEGYAMWEGGGRDKRVGKEVRGGKESARAPEREKEKERESPATPGWRGGACPATERENERSGLSLSGSDVGGSSLYDPLVADHPHSVLRREFQPDSKQKTVGISVGTTLCPYGWPMVGF